MRGRACRGPSRASSPEASELGFLLIRCLEASARGYLLKDTSWAPLFAAIRPVARGEMLVWREAIERLLARDVALATNMANAPGHAAGTGRFGALTPAAITLFERAWNPGA